MHEHCCAISNKKELCGIISSALKLSTNQNKSVTNTFESHEKQVVIVMESIWTKVSEDGDTKKSANRRGQATRNVYTNEFKYKINNNDVVEKYGVHKSLLSKWKKNAKIIEDAVAQKQKNLLKKIRPSTRHKDLF